MVSCTNRPFTWRHPVMCDLTSVKKSRGVVLPTVLWITVLTIMVASNFTSDVRINTHATDNIKSAMTLKYDATSAVYIAIEKLLSGETAESLKFNYAINNSDVDIEIRSEKAKTNINTADERQLTETSIQTGVMPEMAQRLTDLVIDWRDPDSLTQLYGMEDQDYFNLGKQYGAKDKRFEDLVELLLMADIEPEMFRRISQAFTIYAKNAGKLFTINSTAHDRSSHNSYAINTIIQLTYQSQNPYRILKWRYNQS